MRIKGEQIRLEVLDGLSTITHLCLEIHAGATFQQASISHHMAGLSRVRQMRTGCTACRKAPESVQPRREGALEAQVQWTEAPKSEDRAAPHHKQAHSAPCPSKIRAPLENVLICTIFHSSSGKESACRCRRCGRHGFKPWVRKVPLE